MNKRLENRIPELDVFRGIAVLLMVFDHLMYNLWGLLPMLFSDYPTAGGASEVLAQLAVGYWIMPARKVIRYAVVAVFLLLTGICCSLSRSNLKRGLKLMGVALLVTAVTYGVGRFTGDPDICITFGVLHCIALALIFVGLLEKLNVSKRLYLALGLIMSAVGLLLFWGSEFCSYADTPLGLALWREFTGTALYGGDCFPFPLFGAQVFLGVYLGRRLYPERRSLLPDARYKNNAVTFVGRHSLAVYLLHQIILPVLLSIILLCLGFHLAI